MHKEKIEEIAALEISWYCRRLVYIVPVVALLWIGLHHGVTQSYRVLKLIHALTFDLTDDIVMCLLVARQRPWLQRQQYSLPERPGCYTLSKTFLARDGIVLYVHSDDVHHAYQSAHRNLQVVQRFTFFTLVHTMRWFRFNFHVFPCKKKKRKKNIYNAHIVMNHEAEALRWERHQSCLLTMADW